MLELVGGDAAYDLSVGLRVVPWFLANDLAGVLRAWIQMGLGAVDGGVFVRGEDAVGGAFCDEGGELLLGLLVGDVWESIGGGNVGASGEGVGLEEGVDGVEEVHRVAGEPLVEFRFREEHERVVGPRYRHCAGANVGY